MKITNVTILNLRKKLGLSQAEFGRRIGVSQSEVSLWESGARNPNGSALIVIGDMKKQSAGKNNRRGA